MVYSDQAIIASLKISKIEKKLGQDLGQALQKRVLFLTQLLKKSKQFESGLALPIIQDSAIANLEIVIKKQMSFFGNFFIVRDLEEG